MSRISNILGQLQDKLFWKYDKSIGMDEGSLSGGPEFVNQYPTDDDKDTDVPETVDTPYTTHRPFVLPTADKRRNKLPFESKTIKEQEKDEDPDDIAAKASETGEEISSDIGGGDTGEDVGDTGGMDAGMDTAGMGGMDTGMGMGGMPGMEEEEPKTAGQLGRIYELKKIYSRLTSIEAYLGNESSPELLEVRNLVSKSIELFEIVSSNFDSYKEKLDDIIITYYKFIMEVYKEVKDYFKKEAKSGE